MVSRGPARVGFLELGRITLGGPLWEGGKGSAVGLRLIINTKWIVDADVNEMVGGR